jgi:hypothetical protein
MIEKSTTCLSVQGLERCQSRAALLVQVDSVATFLMLSDSSPVRLSYQLGALLICQGLSPHPPNQLLATSSHNKHKLDAPAIERP